MNTKLSLALWSAVKVGGHILIAALVTGLIAYFSHHPEFILYMPIVNVITSGLIKYFSLTPEDIAAANGQKS